MKHVQLIGHTAEGADDYVGLEREVTVDESNQQLRLHDGATPGGRTIASRDELDTRYQAKNPELDGFNFGEEEKGFLVRLGAGDFRVRQLVVQPNEITIEFGNGQGDDPIIGLADEIGGDRTFIGAITFLQSIEAAEIIGPLFGDVIADEVVANTVIAEDFNGGEFHGTHYGQQVGDGDFRGFNIFFDDGQIPLSAIADIPAGPAPVPVGFIGMWSGTADSIPVGWFLCDGTNGTPDMREKFIYGANPGTVEPLSQGGSATHNHVIELEDGGTHSHDITVDDHILTTAQTPSHKHSSGVCDNVAGDVFNRGAVAANPVTGNSVESNSADGIHEGWTSETGGDQAHNHGGSSADSGNHTHAASSQNSNHLPPYMAFCFIMKGP